jgi:FMN phosphatase YigB (HAD superfamily)
MPDDIVFLLDVDNTLLDNDRFAADLSARLAHGFGTAGRDRYWAHYARLRDELGYADYLGSLQAFRAGLDEHPDLLQMSSFLLDYPFTQLLYPRALETIAHLRTLGLPVVMSDGDVVFQPRKVQRSGIWEAVDGRVLIQPHKQHALDGMQRRYPAAQYVMVDDKRQLLAAMKQVMGARLTTVFVRQGHYAIESVDAMIHPAPDISIECISGLIGFDRADFATAAPACSATSIRGTRAPEYT